MDSAMEILKIIQNTARYEANKTLALIEIGEVLEFSDNLVEILLANGSKISGNNIYLSDRCLPRTIKIPYDDDASHIHKIDAKTEVQKVSLTTTATIGTGGVGAISDSKGHTHDIKINTKPALTQIKLWRGLIKGDLVVMLKMSNGRYFALERASFKDNKGGDAANTIYNPKDKEIEKDEDNPDVEPKKAE